MCIHYDGGRVAATESLVAASHYFPSTTSRSPFSNRALALNEEHRPQSVNEFRNELQKCLHEGESPPA
jgi:hypothetical protein